MSTVTDALEVEVGAIKTIHGQAGAVPLSPRERAVADGHFTRLLRLIAPRIRHFIRAYGLLDMREDAEQACAIGLFRAIEAYDPAKARFTTFVNWQLRGELQSLRFRVRPDARESARKVSAVTVSYDALCEDEGSSMLDDADALGRTEALAAETLARRACGTLLDEYVTTMRNMGLRQLERRSRPRGKECVKPGTVDPRELNRLEAKLRRERDVVTAHIWGDDETLGGGSGGLSAEQRRQIARRAIRAMSERARGNPRFDPDALEIQPPSQVRH
jgi:RNA polymerase sigma-32 factor